MTKASSTRHPISIKAVVKAIGMPTEDWEGNCFGIAIAIVKAGLIAGKAVYGTYRGPISDNGYWASRSHLEFVHHGWIRSSNTTIIDPTRWSFEAVDPYIYTGPADSQDYDLYGMKVRRSMMKPCPSKTSTDQLKKFKLSEGSAAAISALVGEDQTGVTILSMSQIFWLANLDPTLLGESAKEIYEALVAGGFKAFIPIDSDQFVRGSRY
jgi:hypothetical protein